MDTIVIIILAIIVGLISISQYFSFVDECEDLKAQLRYKILAFSLAGSAFMSVIMTLTYGTPFSFFFYGVDKIFRVLIMAEIILLTREMVSVDKEYISAFLSFISYGAATLFIIDTFAQGGVLEKGLFGVYFYPMAPWHRALYFIYFIAYVLMLTTFVMYRGVVLVKKSEKQDVSMLIVVYFSSAFGFIAELFIINYQVQYFPVAIFCNLVSVIFLRQLIKYHDSISTEARKFAKELDPGRTDIAFVLDDKLNILYQNKRAEVFANIVNDTFVGRKLSDVFEFADATFGQINSNPDEIPFGIIARYAPTDKQVNMVIQHRMNNYNEIVATTVFVYNIEDEKKDKSKTEAVVKNDNDDKIVESAINVTKNARVLVVDEDVLFLNVFTRMLKKYDLIITRATSGNDALALLENNVYDIVFVSYEMKRMSGKETVMNIRDMAGEYYRQVPIVFITNSDINEVYDDFIKTGFSDYLRKPIANRGLSQVLTRWLWQRFDDDKPEEADTKSAFDGLYTELNNLVEDATFMFEHDRMDKFEYIILGIRRAGMKLSLVDIVDLASNIDEAVMFEEYEVAKQLFERLIIDVRDATTFNAECFCEQLKA